MHTCCMLGALMARDDLRFDPPTSAICGHCGRQLSVCDRTPACFVEPVRFWDPDLERHETLEEARHRRDAQRLAAAQPKPTSDDTHELRALEVIVKTLQPLTAGARARVLLFAALRIAPEDFTEKHLQDLLQAARKP